MGREEGEQLNTVETAERRAAVITLKLRLHLNQLIQPLDTSH